jgi:hypothetical protein
MHGNKDDADDEDELPMIRLIMQLNAIIRIRDERKKQIR